MKNCQIFIFNPDEADFRRYTERAGTSGGTWHVQSAVQYGDTFDTQNSGADYVLEDISDLIDIINKTNPKFKARQK